MDKWEKESRRLSNIDRGIALAHDAQTLLCKQLSVSADVSIDLALQHLDDIILILHNTRICDPPSDE